MKKILITGGFGFIGTNLIIELLKDTNNKILNIDKFSISSNFFLKKYNFKNLVNVKLNLLNYEKVKQLIFNFKPDLVFHLAAETHVDRSLLNPISHYDNNTKATLNLLCILEPAFNKKILKKGFKFIYIGTDEVYGDLDFKSRKTFDENQSLEPNNPYAASKAAAAMTVKTWYKNFNFPSIITNSVNNYGKFQYVEKFIPRSILLGMNKKNIEVYGTGQNIRSWISVNDYVKALIFISKKGKIGDTYNISSGQAFKNIDVAKKILQNLKDRKFTTNISFIKDRLGHDRKYELNFNKLINLGWKPSQNFDDEIKKVIEWYADKRNMKLFKKVNENLLRKGLVIR